MKVSIAACGLAVMASVSRVSVAHGAASIGDAISLAADRLQSQPPQTASGDWSGESPFTGPIIAGLANAYDITGNVAYKNSATLGGAYVMRPGNIAGTYAGNTLYHFGGEDVFGISRLSDISSNPGSNTYRTSLETYYGWIKNVRSGSTAQFINDLQAGSGNASNYIASLAQYTSAAAYVGAADTSTFRAALMSAVANIAEEGGVGYNNTPVADFGFGLWALAKSGPLDGTVITGTGVLSGKSLSQLPNELLALQVASGPQAGSFYYDWLFTADTLGSGFTEDTAWSVSALRAVASVEETNAYNDAIASGQFALAAGIAGDGSAFDHIYDPLYQMHLYAGETLIALPEPTAVGTVVLVGGAALLKRGRRIVAT